MFFNAKQVKNEVISYLQSWKWVLYLLSISPGPSQVTLARTDPYIPYSQRIFALILNSLCSYCHGNGLFQGCFSVSGNPQDYRRRR